MYCFYKPVGVCTLHLVQKGLVRLTYEDLQPGVSERPNRHMDKQRKMCPPPTIRNCLENRIYKEQLA